MSITETPAWFLISTAVVWLFFYRILRAALKDSDALDWVMVAVISGSAAAVSVGVVGALIRALL